MYVYNLTIRYIVKNIIDEIAFAIFLLYNYISDIYEKESNNYIVYNNVNSVDIIYVFLV